VKKTQRILVCGGGGFIGGHVVADLRRRGYRNLRAVDVKQLNEWYQRFDDVDNMQRDLTLRDACYESVADMDILYNFASDMGGMGFIENNKAACMLSVLINTHLLMAARDVGIARYLFASSACVYPADRQASTEAQGLKESDVYPAEPEDGYGWEKLFSERMCRHFAEDYGVPVRVVRYHNVYGPQGTYDGGREKAPAAICRKIALAKITGRHEIEIWGDGQQTRSFMYIDDCVVGTDKIMRSSVSDPINLGSDRLVTINELVDIVETIAGIRVERIYNRFAPQGVRGRNSDNTLIRRKIGWAPSIPLETGLEATYRWIHDRLARQDAA
jgi:GDP-D-mannose 3',5'-epimerase